MKKLFKISLMAVALTLLNSCASITYETPQGHKIHIKSMLKKVAIGDLEVRIHKDGSKVIIVKGYESNPQAEALKKAIETLSKLAVP